MFRVKMKYYAKDITRHVPFILNGVSGVKRIRDVDTKVILTFFINSIISFVLSFFFLSFRQMDSLSQLGLLFILN